MLDYEQMPNIHLSIGVKNQAEFHHSVASRFRMHSTPVRIQVINVQEGPTFDPNSMTFSVQEGVRGDALTNYVLGTYTAVDLDTGNPATNVRYCRPFACVRAAKRGSVPCWFVEHMPECGAQNILGVLLCLFTCYRILLWHWHVLRMFIMFYRL